MSVQAFSGISGDMVGSSSVSVALGGFSRFRATANKVPDFAAARAALSDKKGQARATFVLFNIRLSIHALPSSCAHYALRAAHEQGLRAALWA